MRDAILAANAQAAPHPAQQGAANMHTTTPSQQKGVSHAPTSVPRSDPRPRNMPLPLGGEALVYSRENLTQLYRCSHGELGRLLARKMGPLPIRFDGGIWWFVDEALRDQAQAIRTLERWRTRR